MENSFLNVSVQKRMFTVINPLTDKKYQFVNSKSSKKSDIQESIKNYTNLLTNLIEKELDGGTIDLIEKRNLKLPIQNFLSNPFIKSELQL